MLDPKKEWPRLTFYGAGASLLLLASTGSLFVYFLGCSGLPARSEWPRWAHSSCCSGVIGVGVSLAATELQRIVSSNPGAEKMKVRLTGSVPVFFKLIQVFAGIKTSPPAWRSRS